jgi:hypothetical protein
MKQPSTPSKFSVAKLDQSARDALASALSAASKNDMHACQVCAKLDYEVRLQMEEELFGLDTGVANISISAAAHRYGTTAAALRYHVGKCLASPERLYAMEQAQSERLSQLTERSLSWFEEGMAKSRHYLTDAEPDDQLSKVDLARAWQQHAVIGARFLEGFLSRIENLRLAERIDKIREDQLSGLAVPPKQPEARPEAKQGLSVAQLMAKHKQAALGLAAPSPEPAQRPAAAPPSPALDMAPSSPPEPSPGWL